MRQGTGYAYGDSDDWIISYKCEGCGQRIRVTPDQAQHFRGAFTACSRLCVLKAHERRTARARLGMGPEGEAAPA
jgi:hypothetical protein